MFVKVSFIIVYAATFLPLVRVTIVVGDSTYSSSAGGEIGVFFDGLEKRFDREYLNQLLDEGKLLARFWIEGVGRIPSRWISVKRQVSGLYAAYVTPAGIFPAGSLIPRDLSVIGENEWHFWWSIVLNSKTYYASRNTQSENGDQLLNMVSASGYWQPGVQPKQILVGIAERTTVGTKRFTNLCCFDLSEEMKRGAVEGPRYTQIEGDTLHWFWIRVEADALNRCPGKSWFYGYDPRDGK